MTPHTGARREVTYSALPVRGYQKIWNEWYRDQDLQDEAEINTGSGGDGTTDNLIKRVAWSKDYFTAARPWTQKGDEVQLPLGDTAPVHGDGNPITYATQVAPNSTFTMTYANDRESTGHGPLQQSGNRTLAGPGSSALATGGLTSGMIADLAKATGASINDLSKAVALQRYAENRAAYGSRYVEYLRSLGVRSSDARLQRPEYLGGGQQSIQMSEILQTGPDARGAGVGSLKGHGIGVMKSNRYRRFFEEHGYVHSFISVKPRTVYTQGLDRHWLKRTKEDFYQKELAHIGRQEVLTRELYDHLDQTNHDEVFGYQDRYDEYRTQFSRAAAQFRSDGEYENWHLGRVFASKPALNRSFIECTPANRIYADQAVDQIQAAIRHSIQARRIVHKTGTPSIF